MITKVYMTFFCENVKKNVPLSYEVLYFARSPKLGNFKCELPGNYNCSDCPVDVKNKAIVKNHFDEIYKKKFKPSL